jgi:hypothetical protein
MRISGLHVRDLVPIRKADWPSDCPNWDNRMPNMVVVGGVNGSGKSTLLDFIYWMCRGFEPPAGWPPVHLPRDASGWVDFEVSTPKIGKTMIRSIYGDANFVVGSRIRNQFVWMRTGALKKDLNWADEAPAWNGIVNTENPSLGIFFVPSERDGAIPEDQSSGPKRRSDRRFAHLWRQPKREAERVDTLLETLRSDYLNAKEEGIEEPLRLYEACLTTFEHLTQGTKRIVWRNPENGHFRPLIEVVATGEIHDIKALSSGEKQLLLLGTEIRNGWLPGSILLVDEPELHLHDIWLTRLWHLLENWQREIGGQVILATQSNHLFKLAGPHKTYLLGEESLA